MPVQRKIFRIEEGAHAGPRSETAGDFMAELQALRALIAPLGPADGGTMERARAHIAEAHACRAELDLIHAAVKRSADDTLAHDDAQTARAIRELQAIVAGAEQATQSILQSAEEIEQTADQLIAAARSEHDKAVARGIRERVVRIVEACHFQDLTGQRVANVMAVLGAIEERVARLRTIWRGLERFDQALFGKADEPDRRYLNGPKLPGDRGHSTQDDVDGFFLRTS
jgi:chemotaxis protein CheZ